MKFHIVTSVGYRKVTEFLLHQKQLNTLGLAKPVEVTYTLSVGYPPWM